MFRKRKEAKKLELNFSTKDQNSKHTIFFKSNQAKGIKNFRINFRYVSNLMYIFYQNYSFKKNPTFLEATNCWALCCEDSLLAWLGCTD